MGVYNQNKILNTNDIWIHVYPILTSSKKYKQLCENNLVSDYDLLIKVWIYQRGSQQSLYRRRADNTTAKVNGQICNQWFTKHLSYRI